MRRYRIVFLLLLTLIVVSCADSGNESDTEAKGNIKRIVETGELAAIKSHTFTIQRYGRRWNNFKIIGILKHGTRVEEGDSVIQLDPTEIQKYIIDRQGDLENQLASLEKLQEIGRAHV